MSIPSKGSWNTAIKLNDRFYGIGYANGLFFFIFLMSLYLFTGRRRDYVSIILKRREGLRTVYLIHD